MQTEIVDTVAEAERLDAPAAQTAAAAQAEGGEEGDEDEDQIDLAHIQSFAEKVQHRPGHIRPQITIPKRGEKDFEPLEETVNLQEMMLQRSREALFGALQGVRGGSSKSMSHALYSPQSPYPYLLITHGRLLDSMGISIRPIISTADGGKGKGKARTELLPEEALFLLERGALQIWLGNEGAEEGEGTEGTWSEEECGVIGAVEMSVSEGFAAFLGKDGLTWERYQAYAYLKRLGYTVQRTPRFLPEHFKSVPFASAQESTLPPFRTWWASVPTFLSRLIQFITSAAARAWRRIRFNPNLTHLSSWTGIDYPSLFRHLRLVPSSHAHPLPSRSASPNPYLPFYHIWKPAVPWSKAKWERGSPAGLLRQPPDFQAAAINARTTPLPSIQQLHEIFEESPEEHRGPVQRLGPQYRQVGNPGRTNPIAELRNGDRAFIVAVNDSGNSGWVRFGRTGFAGLAMV